MTPGEIRRIRKGIETEIRKVEVELEQLHKKLQKIQNECCHPGMDKDTMVRCVDCGFRDELAGKD